MSDNTIAEDHLLLTLVFGGTGGIVLVLVVLSCVCKWKKSSSRMNETSDGYQDIRETVRGLRQHPFRRKEKKAFVNGAPNNSQANSLNCSLPHARLHNFPSGPLPVLPTSSTSSIATTGACRGMVTRESSTSELYASVDRNHAANEVDLQRNSSSSRDVEGRRENDEHTYSKIRPPPGMYDEIDEVPPTCSNRRSTPAVPFIISQSGGIIDPLYSRVTETKGATPGGPAPPPPQTRSSHPYDYPKFLTCNGRDRWHAVDTANSMETTVADCEIIGTDSQPELFVAGDAVYSKIDSQYDGSEDPYSSIKSSEEHYSCVVPNRTSNGSSSGDENHVTAEGRLHGRLGTAPAYSSIRPRSVRFIRPRRSHSYGEEYSVIQKPSTSRNSDNSCTRNSRAPPVPEKRYSVVPYAVEWRGPLDLDVAGPSTTVTAAAGVNSFGSYTADDQENPIADDTSVISDTTTAKREPNYRFITVRESLDALRARMEAAVAVAPHVAPAAASSTQSDSSVHYYATISENSYEVVASRRGSEGAQQEELVNSASRTVSYIDDDPYETGVEGQFGDVPNRSPNSTIRVESDTSSNTLMNISVHSHTGSHATSSGSHVTLVHVGGLPSTMAVGEGPSVPDGRCQGRQTKAGKPPVGRQSSSESTCSTGAALSIDIESNFGVDENLSTLDQRDFNPSTTGECLETDRSGYVGSDDQALQHHASSHPKEHHSNTKSPEIVNLETLENFNVSCNSLNNNEMIQLPSGSTSVHV